MNAAGNRCSTTAGGRCETVWTAFVSKTDCKQCIAKQAKREQGVKEQVKVKLYL